MVMTKMRPSLTAGAERIGAGAGASHFTSPVLASSRNTLAKGVETTSFPSAQAMPPPNRLSSSSSGVRSLRQVSLPVAASCALTTESASIANTAPPATTGSASRRLSSLAEAPISTDQSCCSAPEPAFR